MNPLSISNLTHFLLTHLCDLPYSDNRNRPYLKKQQPCQKELSILGLDI